MRWQGRPRSTRVEDRRGMRPGGAVAAGGIGTVVVVLVIALLTGADPRDVADVVSRSQVPGASGEQGPLPPEEDEQAAFVSVVLADTEKTWQQLLPDFGRPYQEPVLVLFSGETSSSCGLGSSAMGPFYCPLDQRVYLDLSFFVDLDQRFGAPGEFARAYVVAHEVGHHVQNLMGITERIHGERQRLPAAAGNELSVRLELQADCLAGVWGYHAATERQMLEPGDAEDGLRAAAAIGDDRMQRQGGGRVAPESFTHGTSAQRARWLRRGLETGDPEQCDTFGAQSLEAVGTTPFTRTAAPAAHCGGAPLRVGTVAAVLDSGGTERRTRELFHQEEGRQQEGRFLECTNG